MSASGPGALARRLVVGLAGPVLADRERDWLKRRRPAGVILFARNVTDREQLRALCADLHALDPALEIVADHEGGPVSQLQAAIGRPPAPWTLGALDDVDLTRRVHRETGLRCRDVGLDRVLAPCCDVLVEPRNPVIGSRAFGSDTDRVARHAAAAAAGLREAGLGACAKHWPGHGGSRVDSHLGLARAGAGALPVPFAAACAAGCEAVMIGHLLSGGAGSGERPASLDPVQVAAAAACGPGGRSTWADDITMGALREFLGGERPATDAAPFAAGMLDPELLTPRWLAEVAASGCDRLLIRGIPWGALPAEGGAEPTRTGRAAARRGRHREFDDAPYDEARRRAGEAAGLADFAALDRDLVWLDLTEGDRWQGPHPERARGAMLERLRSGFRNVVRCTLQEPATVPGSGRLLVTSHRAWPDGVGLPPVGGETGRCLVMGHPSLASDLVAMLPPGWSTYALFDAAATDCGF